MSSYSERTATSLGSVLPRTTRINTIRDFLQVLSISRVQRVQRESSSAYRSKILNDKGSQFVVYTDDGIKAYGQPSSVVKCAKFALSTESLTRDAEARVRAIQSPRFTIWLLNLLRELSTRCIESY